MPRRFDHGPSGTQRERGRIATRIATPITQVRDVNLIVGWVIALALLGGVLLMFRYMFKLSWWMLAVMAIGGLAIQHAAIR